MNAEILPISLEDKARMLAFCRTDVIPTQVKKDEGIEICLRRFHEIGTLYSPPIDERTSLVIEGYKLFFSNGPTPTAFGLRERLVEFSQYGPEKYTSFDNYIRGGYRILGCFEPNPRLAEHAPEADSYFTAAIPVSSKDYLFPDGPLYLPPVFNIHKLMGAIGDRYDNRLREASKEWDIAKATADFYFWGLVMIHPYLGANHRAFDRAIEYGFASKGLELRVPENETLNIPNEDPFNVALYRERHRILADAGINVPQNLPARTFIHDARWLDYQHQLNEMINDNMLLDTAKVDEVAQAILAWR